MSLKSFCGMKKEKDIQIIKEEVKFTLFADDMLSMENTKDSIKEN